MLNTRKLKVRILICFKSLFTKLNSSLKKKLKNLYTDFEKKFGNTVFKR